MTARSRDFMALILVKKHAQLYLKSEQIKPIDFPRLSRLKLVPIEITLTYQYQPGFQTNSLEHINPVPVVSLYLFVQEKG